MASEIGVPVGELSRRTGVSPATINFYVNRGLLPHPLKTARTRATYPLAMVDRIARIKDFQDKGLPLAVIARLLDSPNPAAELGLFTTQARSPRGPVGLTEYLELTGLDRDVLVRLIEGEILRPNRDDSGLVFDRADLAAGRAAARLLNEDVEIEMILRHDEFQPVSRAEAHFLAEHLSQAMRMEPSHRKATAARAAFATLRDYMRLRELENEYPDWDQPRR
ncbi:MAG: MerR family transcriptional regulator [Dehalococcoidia bacterium]|nr:MerR family transcriptional regulator [Dehalococcoidia bacterium]